MKMAGIALATSGLIVASPAMAACERWEISKSDFGFLQSNKYEGFFRLQRDEGDWVFGTAQFYSPSLNQNIKGTVDGTISADRLHLRIHWEGPGERGGPFGPTGPFGYSERFDETGIYDAEISPNGEVRGTTYSYTRPARISNWFMRYRLECASAPPPPPPPPPPNVRSPAIAASDSLAGQRKASGLDVRSPAVTDSSSVTNWRSGSTPTPSYREDPTMRIAPVRSIGKIPSPDTCMTGYVWREAGPSDRVCVPSYVRARTLRENELADTRRDPNGAYGPNTCIAGFVWREAFPGDAVCVAPYVRAEAAQHNGLSSERRRQQ